MIVIAPSYFEICGDRVSYEAASVVHDLGPPMLVLQSWIGRVESLRDGEAVILTLDFDDLYESCSIVIRLTRAHGRLALRVGRVIPWIGDAIRSWADLTFDEERCSWYPEDIGTYDFEEFLTWLRAARLESEEHVNNEDEDGEDDEIQ
jgi:hypothetical protein